VDAAIYTIAETKFPSWEGWREAPGWFPRAVRGKLAISKQQQQFRCVGDRAANAVGSATLQSGSKTTTTTIPLR
jgi:hypothetical protein